MARVEVSQSIGPGVVKSVGDPSPVSTATSGPAFKTETYTVHSYQVIIGGALDDGGTTDLAFEVYATNDSDTNYQVIASYVIDNANNSTGIMYSDIWNFKYAYCKISGTFAGATITVIEKHNP
tara:strand:- start:35 stop:403 length:369 start_codon:yes stop_codon:yes gene_type:complete